MFQNGTVTQTFNLIETGGYSRLNTNMGSGESVEKTSPQS